MDGATVGFYFWNDGAHAIVPILDRFIDDGWSLCNSSIEYLFTDVSFLLQSRFISIMEGLSNVSLAIIWLRYLAFDE